MPGNSFKQKVSDDNGTEFSADPLDANARTRSAGSSPKGSPTGSDHQPHSNVDERKISSDNKNTSPIKESEENSREDANKGKEAASGDTGSEHSSGPSTAKIEQNESKSPENGSLPEPRETKSPDNVILVKPKQKETESPKNVSLTEQKSPENVPPAKTEQTDAKSSENVSFTESKEAKSPEDVSLTKTDQNETKASENVSFTEHKDSKSPENVPYAKTESPINASLAKTEQKDTKAPENVSLTKAEQKDTKAPENVSLTKAEQKYTKAPENVSLTKAEQKDSKSPDNSSLTKTPPKRVPSGGKSTVTRQNRFDHSKDEQLDSTRTSSTSPKASPRPESRIPRSIMDKFKHKDDKADETQDKLPKQTESNSSKPAATPPADITKPSESKESKPEAVGTKIPQLTSTKTVEPQTSNVSSGIGSTEKTQDTVNSTLSTKHPDDTQQTKPPNGLIQGDMKAKVKDKTAEEDDEQKRKATALFNKAVLRRLGKVSDSQNPAGGQQPGNNNNNNNNPLDLNSSLNSSAGARSLSSSPSAPRPAHKTTSMQSLTVPGGAGVGVGGQPLTEVDPEKVSLGSRKDSVRQSLDSASRKYLQNSQAVVAGEGSDEKPKSPMMHDDSHIRAAIPALPLPLAVLCLMLNIMLPGSGTALSGVSVMCCGKSRVTSKGDSRYTSLCTNLMVAIAQLATVSFLLVGWFWSLAWGVKMVIIAVEHREELKQQREKELQTLALKAFGSPGNARRFPV